MQKISVILTVFNTAQYLKDCLDSLIKQSYSNIEIICINDGSTDNSLDILYEYAQKDNRIKVYSQENQGIASSRNTGLNLAEGDYITFVDSDDIISENALETAINTANLNNSNMVINYKFLNKSIQDFSWVATWQMFIRKSFLDEHEDLIFNTDLKKGSDAVFSHKILALTNKISKNIGKSYYLYRQHQMQITNTFDKNTENLLLNLKLRLDDIINFYKKYDLFEKHNYLLMNFIMEQIFGHYVVSKWNNSQKKELFNLIHNTIRNYNLKSNFNFKDRKAIFFFIFLNCKTAKEFEFTLFFAKMFYKLQCLVKKIVSKNFIKC